MNINSNKHFLFVCCVARKYTQESREIFLVKKNYFVYSRVAVLETVEYRTLKQYGFALGFAGVFLKCKQQ